HCSHHQPDYPLKQTTPMVFILGIERSATTWVANIVDCHPQAEVFMEPLSRYTSGFKAWPDRFVRIDDSERMATMFASEFEKLKKHKRFFFSRWFNQPWAWRVDFSLADAARKKIQVNRVEDFLELNFHRRSEVFFLPKEPTPDTVIKELRLNFNASIIRQLDKASTIIMVVRDMASNICSMQKQLDEGNLVELKQALFNRYGTIDYESLCNYWWESYRSLLHSLDQLGMNYLIIDHTDLLTDTKTTVEQLFQFMGCEVPQQALCYINA